MLVTKSVGLELFTLMEASVGLYSFLHHSINYYYKSVCRIDGAG